MNHYQIKEDRLKTVILLIQANFDSLQNKKRKHKLANYLDFVTGSLDPKGFIFFLMGCKPEIHFLIWLGHSCTNFVIEWSENTIFCHNNPNMKYKYSCHRWVWTHDLWILSPALYHWAILICCEKCPPKHILNYREQGPQEQSSFADLMIWNILIVGSKKFI